jgi:hypothetical protein
MAFKMKGFGGFGNSPMKQDKKNKEYATYGDTLYNYDGTVNKKATKAPESSSKIYTDKKGNKVVDYTFPDGSVDVLRVDKPKK